MGLNGVQFCDCSCSCAYCDFEFLRFVFSTLRSRSCFQTGALLTGTKKSCIWILVLYVLILVPHIWILAPDIWILTPTLCLNFEGGGGGWVPRAWGHFPALVWAQNVVPTPWVLQVRFESQARFESRGSWLVIPSQRCDDKTNAKDGIRLGIRNPSGTKVAKVEGWSPMEFPVKWYFSKYKFDMKRCFKKTPSACF